MLALYFFSLVFSTLVWLIYSISYIFNKLDGISMMSLGILDTTIYVSFVLLPILVVWLVFGYVNQYLLNKNCAKSFMMLFKQAKKSQEYSDLIARAMIELDQQIKSSFILNRIDLLVSDINEIMAEIIQLNAIASQEQIERLWIKVQNGGKWAFGRVIVDVSQAQPNFQARLYEKSVSNVILAGSVMEFCARYLNLVALLEKHDREKVFLNTMETGILGKVFSILAPVSDEIRKSREVKSVFQKQQNMEPVSNYSPIVEKELSSFAETPKEAPDFLRHNSDVKEKSSMKFGFFKKKNPNLAKNEPKVASSFEKDPFSVALERSFGHSEEVAPEPYFSEPVFAEPQVVEEEIKQEVVVEVVPEVIPEVQAPVVEEPTEEVVVEEMVELTDTQKALNELKKEWEDMSASNKKEDTLSQETEEDSFYPFGGWANEENYKK